MENISSDSAAPQKVDKVDALDIANNNIGKYYCKSCDMSFFTHWTLKEHNSSIHNLPSDDSPKPKSETAREASKKPVDEEDVSSDDSDVDSDHSSDDDSNDFEDPDLVKIPGAKIQPKTLANIEAGPSGNTNREVQKTYLKDEMNLRKQFLKNINRGMVAET